MGGWNEIYFGQDNSPKLDFAKSNSSKVILLEIFQDC